MCNQMHKTGIHDYLFLASFLQYGNMPHTELQNNPIAIEFSKMICVKSNTLNTLCWFFFYEQHHISVVFL